MPHPPPASPQQPPARRSVMAFTLLVAIIATTVSAQGMVLFGITALRWELGFAIAGATICEAAMVAYALLAREALRTGHGWQRDMWMTRLLAIVSGLMSAAYSTVHLVGDTHVFLTDAATPFTVAMRLGAPLLACQLWHRVILGDAHLNPNTPTLHERRLHARLLDVAWTAHDLNNTPEHKAAEKAVLQHTLGKQWRSVLALPAHQRADLDVQLAAVRSDVATLTSLTEPGPITPTLSLPESPMVGSESAELPIAVSAQEPPPATDAPGDTPDPSDVAHHGSLTPVNWLHVDPAPDQQSDAAVVSSGSTKTSRAPWPPNLRRQVLNAVGAASEPSIADIQHAALQLGHQLPRSTARRWLAQGQPQ